MIKKEKLEEAIKITIKELEQDEWIDRYDKYADLMLKYEESKLQLGKKFREWEPLKFYLNVTNAKTGKNSLIVSVRYLGQEVANIKADDTGVYIYTDVTKKTNTTNKNNFECNITLDKSLKIKWDSKEANEFRDFFRKRDRKRIDIGKRNDEHRLESLLISEFMKKSSENKTLCGIQPITFAGFRFSMPTAIKSSKNIKKGNANIDIIARTIGKKITVIELKDENKDSEPVEKVLEQATAYSIFILKLLRSKSGEKWYRLLGFSSKSGLPKILTIRVCLAMPRRKNSLDDTFETFKLKCNNDVLEYHWIYFNEKDNEIKDIISSLPQKTN